MQNCLEQNLALHLYLKLNNTDGNELKDPSIYRRLFGRMIYLTISRPDLSYPILILSQFMAKPRPPHLAMAHKVLRYIKETLRQGLMFLANQKLKLIAYCGVDWASCPMTRRSITSY